MILPNSRFAQSNSSGQAGAGGKTAWCLINGDEVVALCQHVSTALLSHVLFAPCMQRMQKSTVEFR